MDWDGDGIPNHAAMVCWVGSDTITYTAHTESRYLQNIIYAYDENPDMIFTVIHLEG